MTLMCDDVAILIVSQDRSRSIELEADEWEFELLRNRIPESTFTVSNCEELDQFERWCDRIEVYVGGELATAHRFTGISPDRDGRATLRGIGQMELLRKRRHALATTYTGRASEVWQEMWAAANGIDATGLQPGLTTGGALLSFTEDAGELYTETASTLNTYITFAEHGGALYDWLTDEEPDGRALEDTWVNDFDCTLASEASDAIANDLEIAYTSDLSQTLRYPPQGLDSAAGCRLQSPRLEFPEIPTQAEALALAQRWQPILSVPEPTHEDLSLDPTNTRLIDLVPGLWHRDLFSDHIGQRFNTDSVVVAGRRNCTTSINVALDHGDGEVRRRVRT